MFNEKILWKHTESTSIHRAEGFHLKKLKSVDWRKKIGTVCMSIASVMRNIGTLSDDVLVWLHWMDNKSIYCANFKQNVIVSIYSNPKSMPLFYIAHKMLYFRFDIVRIMMAPSFNLREFLCEPSRKIHKRKKAWLWFIGHSEGNNNKSSLSKTVLGI